MSVPRSAGVILLGLALTAACGGDDESSPPTSDDGATLDDADLPDEVREAAEWAEANNMLFITTHEEIVRRAEEIGSVRILRDFEQPFADGFSEAYPSLDVYIEESFTGQDTYTRFLLEAEAGALDEWDVAYAPIDHYEDFTSLMAPYDLLGMSQAGILDIPEEMIDPDKRFVATVASQLAGVAYNPDLIDEADLPQQWDDLLDERFHASNTQFLLDPRPANMAPLVALWGQDRVNDLAAGLAAQDPLWNRGNTDGLTRLAAGEHAMFAFTNYNVAVRVKESAPGALEAYLIEPIPVRLSESLGVFNEDVSPNPYAALLFIEWMASPEGQALLDEDPLKSSLFAEGSQVAELIEGKEVAVGGYEHFEKIDDYQAEIVDAMGFPQAEN